MKMKFNIEKPDWYNNLSRNNLSFDTAKNLIDLFKVPGMKSIFEKLKKKWFEADSLDDIIRLLNENKIPFPYSKLLDNLDNLDFNSLISKLKSYNIENFEWDVVTLTYDLNWSSKLSQKDLKEVIWKILYVSNIFEELFSEESLDIFAMAGDELHIWFFSDSISKKEKIEIFQAFSIILEKYTNKKFTYNFFEWEKNKWENITAVLNSNIYNTPISSWYNSVYKTIKQGGLKNYMSKDVLKYLYSFLNPYLEIYKKISWYNILPSKRINESFLRETFEKINSNNIDYNLTIIYFILNYIINNLQNSDLIKDLFKIETIKKWTKLIEFWEENTDLYLVVDWKVKIELNWNEKTTKIITWKTILWEMSIYNRVANATVYTLEDTKVVVLKNDKIKQILKNKDNNIDNYMLNKFYKLILKYINSRDNQNKKLSLFFQKLLDNYTSSFDEKQKILINFIENIFSDIGEKKVIWWKQLTKKGEENHYLYYVKKWSEVLFNGIKYTLTKDTIIWENTFLEYLLNTKENKANADIKILNWNYKKIDFKKFINSHVNEKIISILNEIKRLRSSETHFTNYSDEWVILEDPYAKAA